MNLIEFELKSNPIHLRKVEGIRRNFLMEMTGLSDFIKLFTA